ncbi:AMP-binding protein [Alkalihalobacillus sp. 1P02AB]|uniref:AMP-binding protein n=1 Tax=Alkalihalobacillus sp. 1P02AB TaxID=3132260 RepID=UPI0039A64D43
MLFVNEQFYSVADLEALQNKCEQLNLFEDGEKKRIAVCLNDPFEMLALFFYVRKKGSSITLIHSSSPKEAAVRAANETSSHLLFYQSLENPIDLNRETDESMGVLIQMSSGTTGKPKCIERTWEEIDTEIESYNQALSGQKEKTTIIMCPITHSYGLISGVLSSLNRGITPVIITNQNPKYMVKMLKKYPEHLLYASPALLQTLCHFVEKDMKLDCVMTSGMLLPKKLFVQLKKITNQLSQQYGCSEAGCVLMKHQLTSHEEIGFPLSHLEIETGTDETEPSEIVIHLGNKTIYTKDLGYFNATGGIFYLERIDDMINVAGLNVYPHQVEEVILEHPKIKDIVVYKKTDLYAGERVCCQFVSDEEGLDVQELRKWCFHQLPSHQIPIECKQVNAIERLPNGKISRKKLVEVSG